MESAHQNVNRKESEVASDNLEEGKAQQSDGEEEKEEPGKKKKKKKNKKNKKKQSELDNKPTEEVQPKADVFDPRTEDAVIVTATHTVEQTVPVTAYHEGEPVVQTKV